MSRSRRLHRIPSRSSTSSSSTSPERNPDDDADSFMFHGADDSASSLGGDVSAELAEDEAMRREYEERCRVSPVARLPAELLIHIFSRLASPRDLQTCMLVSKEWARNSVGLLWHRPIMSRWDCIHSVVQSIRKGSKFFAYQDLVKRLNMSTLAGQVSDGTLLGMQDCKRIERLTLTNCGKLTDLSLQPLIEGNRSLLALDVTMLDQLTDRTMMTVADNCLRLQGLNVTNCKRLTDTSIEAIAKNCRHLKRLKFNNCVQLTDASMLTIANNCSHLLEIDLYGLQNLESPAVTALLESCLQLRELRLAHCSRITDAAFLDIPSPPEMPLVLDSLRILDLTDCSELGDKGVEKIIQTCPRLRNLILAKCRQITDRAVFAITRLGKNLHYIHLGHCARITDVSVEALAKACNRIRYIDLACCSNLTDSSVTKLAGLPKLKRIGLVKCAGITDRSICALAIGELKNGRRVHGVSVLERVHLSYCTLLTLDGIHILLNHCPKLTHLSLTGVQAFLRDELLAFCREAPPEFNEHQRDVFCVFSGNGVTRLRDHLNEQKLAAAAAAAAAVASNTAAASAASTQYGGLNILHHADDFDDPRRLTNSQGSTPVMNLNLNSQFAPGETPIIHLPNSPLHHLPHYYQQNFFQPGPPPPHLAHLLSQSAPTGSSSNVGSPIPWSSTNIPIVPPLLDPLFHFNSGSLTPASTNSAQQHLGQAGLLAAGTQHVTGMMGAAGLDEVEGDEVFGEDSEIMDA